MKEWSRMCGSRVDGKTFSWSEQISMKSFIFSCWRGEKDALNVCIRRNRLSLEMLPPAVPGSSEPMRPRRGAALNI